MSEERDIPRSIRGLRWRAGGFPLMGASEDQLALESAQEAFNRVEYLE